MLAVRGVRSVAVDVVSLDAAAEFYSRVWGLVEIAATKGARYFRGSESFHYILSLHDANRPAIRRVVFDAANRDEVATLHAQVSRFGAIAQDPHVEDAPGNAFVFGFKDPEGRSLAVAAGGSGIHRPLPRTAPPRSPTSTSIRANTTSRPDSWRKAWAFA